MNEDASIEDTVLWKNTVYRDTIIRDTKRLRVPESRDYPGPGRLLRRLPLLYFCVESLMESFIGTRT